MICRRTEIGPPRTFKLYEAPIEPGVRRCLSLLNQEAQARQSRTSLNVDKTRGLNLEPDLQKDGQRLKLANTTVAATGARPTAFWCSVLKTFPVTSDQKRE